MQQSLFREHSIMLLTYTAIGFMSGSISHGFFSGQRSVIMAVLGFILFVIAQLLERRFAEATQEKKSRGSLVLIAILFPLGIGMFNGGFQHFLDSPERSLRIIPLGYFLSLLILPQKEGITGVNRKKIIRYGGLIAILFAGLIRGAIRLLPKSVYSELAHDDHGSHGDANHKNDDHHGKKQKAKSRADFSNEEKMNIHMCIMGGKEYGAKNCDAILATDNKATYADAIQEQCEIMPRMAFCESYFGIDTAVETGSAYDLTAKDDYPVVKPTATLNPKNGETIALSLDNVQKTIAGKPVRMMAYNGSVPGPLIKVTQGDQIRLHVTNNIVDIESTIHHHGLRLDHRFDGVPKSMGGFDIPMKKGESLDYTLDFPDAGLFRYHPHVREDMQQELGLYGNYLVMPKDPTYRNPVDREELLMLDDIQMSASGEVAPFYAEYTNQTIMGRYGNHYLINGRENYTLELKQGEVTRLYITNAANVRVFTLSIPGVKMKLVGGDIGAYEQEHIVESLLIAPAERYVVEIAPEKAGSYEIVYTTPEFEKTLGTITVTPSSVVTDAAKKFTSLRQHPDLVSDRKQYAQYFDKKADKTLRLDMSLHGKTKENLSLAMHHDHADAKFLKQGGQDYDLSKIEREDTMYAMNIGSSDKNTTWKLIDEATKLENMDIDRSFEQGDLVKVRIINDGEGLHPMQHPIHFHGQRFLVVSKNGVPTTNLVWKDTVLTLPGEYTDILIDMSNPGTRMAHCHISEHMHAGMMLHFAVK